VATLDDEDELLRSVALQNATSILLARQRAEEELLRTREALRESQERLQAALGAAGTGTFRWNIESNTVEWDGNLGRLFGLEPGRTSAPIRKFLGAVHPQDRPHVIARFEQCARDGSDVDMEFRVVWPDGSVHWISDKARPFFDEAGKPLYVTGACADVSSRKAAAETLRSSEERLRAMFNQAAVGIAVGGFDGHIRDLNRRFADILGYGVDELRQVTFRELTHRDDVEATEEALARLLDGAVRETALEKRYVTKDGTFVWSLTTMSLLEDADGRPEGFLKIIDDITARKHAEAALQEETRVLELLHDTGRELASELDLHTVVQAVTDAGTKLSGARFGAFIYNTTDENGDAFLLDTLSGAPRAAFDELGHPRATPLFGPTFRGEAPIRCNDVLADSRYGRMAPHYGMPKGHLAVRSYLAVPVRSRSGEVIGGLFFGHPDPGVFTERAERLVVGLAAQAGIAIDNARLYEAAQTAADERKALLESERAARTAAERLSEIKDEFLATLSHELRTPLNAILGWSQVLRSGVKSQTDLMKGLQTIERNARAQTQLIDDLLDMSRITSGKLRLNIQSLSPVTVIEAAIETVQPAADAKGIRVERFLDPSAGPISGDPGRLQQVIWNLLSNAIKFTPRDGKVQVLLERVNSHVEISVADTGIGVRPEFIPYLFDRFRQGDASTTRSYGGLGLGLSIVKSIVELHGGSVRAESPGEGLGMTVTVNLPIMVVYRQPGPGERVHPTSSQTSPISFLAADLTGLKVLVVDDRVDARDLVRRVLEECHADVLTAATAAEALRLVQSEMPDVLISDIGMPDANGFELLRRVRALGPERGGRIPAIALTAFARSEDRTRALRAGFLVHVAKPVDPSELVATVASVTGRIDQS
jgi:PAS domain S-box-containing protein